jgi:hypothetical protein
MRFVTNVPCAHGAETCAGSVPIQEEESNTFCILRAEGTMATILENRG